jgi:hypothetical protein
MYASLQRRASPLLLAERRVAVHNPDTGFYRLWNAQTKERYYGIHDHVGQVVLDIDDLLDLLVEVKKDHREWAHEQKLQRRRAREARKEIAKLYRLRKKRKKEKRVKRSQKIACTRCHTPLAPARVIWGKLNRPYCHACSDDLVWDERLRWTRPGHKLFDIVVIYRGFFLLMDAGGLTNPCQNFTDTGEATVKFKNTNRVVTTKHLWHVGEIPPVHRGLFPDNVAEVIGGAGKVQPGGVPPKTS